MSNPQPAPTTAAHHSAFRKGSDRRRVPRLRLALLTFALLLVSLFVPQVFRFAARHAIVIAAWRHGVSVQIERLQGSFFEPVTLLDSVWEGESASGVSTRFEIKRATADLVWRNLFTRTSTRWFRELTIDGLTGKVILPRGGRPAVDDHQWKWWDGNEMGLTGPARIDARNVNFVLQTNGDYTRFEQVRFTASEVETGEFFAGQIAVRQPWLTKTFRNLRGTTALDETRLKLLSLTLEPGVHVEHLTMRLDDIAHARVNFTTQVSGFGGTVKADARVLPRDHAFAFEANAYFSNIAIPSFASFLGLSEAAGGIIKQGQLRFRGSLRDLPRATASLRLDEVRNFQWESRQWDSLVLGATLLDHRVSVAEFALRQGHNRLDLNGDFALPGSGQQWWQGEFAANIAAKIDNLTELSALLLPEFTYAAGQANIDGSIRGLNQKFSGQLIVSGSRLRWRDAPIEELHASVKLEGNELKLTNLSLFNRGDYVRGGGVVNIVGDKQYWGELRASIEDLALYAALLQKPIIPEPLAGGAVINWDGEGSANGHSGRFSANLRKVRSLGASAALLHPLNANLEGSYAPGNMLFGRFDVSDDQSSFTANLAVEKRALSLKSIRLMHGAQLWLEGDALLPLDLWKAWPNTSLAAILDDTTVGQLNLTAYNLQLREAALLTGLIFPIEGLVAGNVVGEGALGSMKTRGSFTLTNSRIPLGWSDVVLSDFNLEAHLAEQTLFLDKLSCRHPIGDLRIGGAIDFTNLRDPSLKLTAASDAASMPLYASPGPSKAAEAASATKLAASLDVRIDGPVSGAVIKGTAQAHAVTLPHLSAAPGAIADGAVDASALWAESTKLELPPAFTWTAEPWSAWRFEIACASPETSQLSPPSDAVALNLMLTGTGDAPALAGTVAFANVRLVAGPVVLNVESARLVYRAANPNAPSIDLVASGVLHDEPFTLYVNGPVARPVRSFTGASALCETAIRAQLETALMNRDVPPAAIAAPRFSLRAPITLASDIPTFDWETSAQPRVEPSAELEAREEPQPAGGGSAP